MSRLCLLLMPMLIRLCDHASMLQESDQKGFDYLHLNIFPSAVAISPMMLVVSIAWCCIDALSVD